MAQMYRFTDVNGEVRLMAEIDPAPGGAQPLSLLGPFPFAFDSPNIKTSGFVVGAIPAGVMLIKGWVISRVFWDSSGTLAILLYVGDPNGDQASIANYRGGNGANALFAGEAVPDPSSTPNYPISVDVLQAASLIVYTDADVTVGEADAYALIYTP